MYQSLALNSYGKKGLAKRLIEFPREAQQFSDLGSGEHGKLLLDQLLRGRDNAVIEFLSFFCEHQGIVPLLLAPFEQIEFLHAVEQLGNVAFRDQEAIRQLLLCDSFMRSYMRQNIKLSCIQVPGSEIRALHAFNFLDDTVEP